MKILAEGSQAAAEMHHVLIGTSEQIAGVYIRRSLIQFNHSL